MITSVTTATAKRMHTASLLLSGKRDHPSLRGERHEFRRGRPFPSNHLTKHKGGRGSTITGPNDASLTRVRRITRAGNHNRITPTAALTTRERLGFPLCPRAGRSRHDAEARIQRIGRGEVAARDCRSSRAVHPGARRRGTTARDDVNVIAADRVECAQKADIRHLRPPVDPDDGDGEGTADEVCARLKRNQLRPQAAARPTDRTSASLTCAVRRRGACSGIGSRAFTSSAIVTQGSTGRG
jgi:hypothetical protein